MPEYIVKLRCPACKFEEDEVVKAESAANSVEKVNRHCPRQEHIKMEVVEIKEKKNRKK